MHYSAIVMDGYRHLLVGEQADFTYKKSEQDGFAFVAKEIRPEGTVSVATNDSASLPAAYKSELTIHLDE